jgi:hypothetical protein
LRVAPTDPEDKHACDSQRRGHLHGLHNAPTPGHVPGSLACSGKAVAAFGAAVANRPPFESRLRSVMEVRRHQPDISPDIPRELRSDLLGKFGRNRECGAGGDRQHIALPGNSKTKESAALSRETPCLKLEKSLFSATSILSWR